MRLWDWREQFQISEIILTYMSHTVLIYLYTCLSICNQPNSPDNNKKKKRKMGWGRVREAKHKKKAEVRNTNGKLKFNER